MALPTVADIEDYLGADADVLDAALIEDAFAAELGNQRATCHGRYFVNNGALYNADLLWALKRRVDRALAFKSLPFAVQRGLDGADPLVLPARDREIARYEAPYPAMVFG